MSEARSEANEYTVNFWKEARGVAIGDKAQVIINQAYPPVGIPFQAPPLPPHFVPRPEVTDPLKAQLLADTATPGVLAISAIHGLGGIGKSVLAAALCHDTEIQSRFPDGILWARLGQKPEILLLLHEWVQELGDLGFRSTTVDGASAHLRSLLHAKGCLLVVDDIWLADHLQYFRVGGPRCQLVITTRDTALARKVGSYLCEVDVMSEAQSLALFESRLGPLQGDDREQAAGLARELDYVPFALELACAQIRADLHWSDLRAVLHRIATGLAAENLSEEELRQRTPRLFAHLVPDQLTVEDREAFVWLGVLKDDARLTPALAAILWEQSEATAHGRILRLQSKALLSQANDDRYTFHDLVHDEAKQRLAERMSLPQAHVTLLSRYRKYTRNGLWHTLPDDGYIHEHLTWHMEQAGQLNAIHDLLREETDQGTNGWYEAREHLGQSAGYLTDVWRGWRLAEGAPNIGQQCRYSLIVSSLNSLASNIPPLLLAALVNKGVWQPAQALTFACQISLPEQRAEALAELRPHLPGSLLRALAFAVRSIPDDFWRAVALVRVAPFLPKPLLKETLVTFPACEEWKQVLENDGPVTAVPEELMKQKLAAAQAIEDQYRQVVVLVDLAPHLSEPLLEKALRTVMFCGEYMLSRAIEWLAPHLPEALLETALTETLEIQNQKWRSWALEAIALHLPESMTHKVKAAAGQLWHEPDRSRVLATLIPRLAELGHLDEALTMAPDVRDRFWKLYMRAALVAYMSDIERDRTSREVLSAARRIHYARPRNMVLSRLALHVSGPFQQKVMAEALKAIHGLDSLDEQAKALSKLVPGLSRELLPKALEIVWPIRDWSIREEIQVELVSKLMELGYPGKALEAAQAIDGETCRGRALVRLASQWVASGRPKEATAILRKVKHEYAWTYAQDLVADMARSGHLREALVTIGIMKGGLNRFSSLAALGYDRIASSHPWVAAAVADEWPLRRLLSQVLVSFSSHLPKALMMQTLERALTISARIGSEFDRAEALIGLAPALSEQQLPEALAVVEQIATDWIRVRGFVGLAPHLSKPLLEQASEAVLNLERSTWPYNAKAEGLIGLAPHLPGDLLARVLAAARELPIRFYVSGVYPRPEALLGLIPYLPQAGLAQVVHEVVEAIRQIEDNEDRAKLLTQIIRFLPEAECIDVGREALTAACRIPYTYEKAKTLLAIIPDLPLEISGEIMAAAVGTEGAYWQATVLAELIPRLSLADKVEAVHKLLLIVQDVTNNEAQAKITNGLKADLAMIPYPILAPIWRGGQGRPSLLRSSANRPREDLLANLRALLPLISLLGGPDAVSDVFYANQDVFRWWP